ncbi:MAG: hypothetical protein CSB28_00810, partial [Desulfobacterales bacterium]
MARKKRVIKNKGKRSPQNSDAAIDDASQFFLENRIIALCSGLKQQILRKEMLTALRAESGVKAVQKALSSLVSQGIIKQRGENWQLSSSPYPKPLTAGVLTVNPRGFGFVALPHLPGRSSREKEPYIAEEAMNGAIHGDQVLVRPFPASLQRGNRPSYIVISIITPVPDILCGILREKRGRFQVSPDDSRIPFTIAVEKTELLGAKAGDAVQVQFSRQH